MAQKKTNEVYYVADDTGYGYLKSYINDQYVYEPTALVDLTNTSRYPEVVAFDELSDKEKEDFFKNIFDRQYVSFDSETLPRFSNHRYLIGYNGYDRSERLLGLSTNDVGKAEQEITLPFILSAIAYKRVLDEYENNNDFDFNGRLIANINYLLTALPVDESRTPEETAKYKNKFLKHPFIVRLHNFRDSDLTVEIKFNEVDITREGFIAKSALYNADKFPELLKHIQKQLDEDYPQKHYDALKLLRSPNVILHDIGAGTIDTVKLIDNRPSRDSNSIPQGYNSVLDKVVNALRNEKDYSFENAHDLDNYLLEDEDTLEDEDDREYQQELKNSVENEINLLENDALQDIKNMLQGTDGSKIKAVIVLGGGANGFNSFSDYKQQLQDTTARVGKKVRGKYVGVPVIWVGQYDPEEAIKLNLLGLYIPVQMKRQK